MTNEKLKELTLLRLNGANVFLTEEGKKLLGIVDDKNEENQENTEESA